MLKLGTAKVDITPQFPVPLAGFEFRSGVFEQVLTRLFARIFFFQPESGPAVILVSADLIWWGSDRVSSMRERMRQQPGAGNAVILLHATHNHSGPQTAATLSPLIGEASPAWLETMENAVIGGIGEAVSTCETVCIARGSGVCDIGIHRRRLVDGTILMAPSRDGPIDPECTVIRFQTLTGETKALLVHFTCHPTTTGGNSVHGEFCGVAMTIIEDRIGNSAIAGFLQGCCGDIRPALIRDDQFYRGGMEDVLRLGSELSGVVLKVLASPMQPCEPTPCTAHQITLPLYFEHTAENTADSALLEMTRVLLGSQLGFFTFNAEMVVRYGFLIKQESLLPLAYTGGMIGYVTTEQQLAEGGYEAREAFRYFRMPGPFAASTESRIHEAIAHGRENPARQST